MTDIRIAPQESWMMFDRKRYFDSVRTSLFPSGMNQGQVDGQEAILGQWEQGERQSDDLRHLAYMLATSRHETASTMLPIEEYGKGQGMSYGKPDPETGQTYYGRGYVQLTWRDNYARASEELELGGENDIEWHAQKALDPQIAADVMFGGMWKGWFRSGHTLFKYFSDSVNDAFNAREIINGDKNYNVDWSPDTIGQIIAGYHDNFLEALEDSAVDIPTPQPRPPRPPRPLPLPVSPRIVTVDIVQPFGVRVEVNIRQMQPPDWERLKKLYEEWRLAQ